MLPTEARFSSLDLFEKPVGPVYSPNGTMLEFAVLDLSKIFLEISCKIVQSFEADLKYDAGAAADVNKTDSPYICNIVLHTMLSDCKLSANVLIISNAN